MRWPFKHKHHWYYFMSFYMPDTRWCFGCAGHEQRDWENEGDWEPVQSASQEDRG